MPNPNKSTINVYVYPGGDPNYQLETKLLKGDELVFNNNGRPGFDISFVLANADQTGYYFPDDASKALAAQKGIIGDGCPTQGMVWDEFTPTGVSADNLTLYVNNKNTKSTDFAFTLFVTEKPHDPKPHFLPLDPIGSNQNGPTSRSFAASILTTTSVSIAIAAIVIIAVALYAFGVIRT